MLRFCLAGYIGAADPDAVVRVAPKAAGEAFDAAVMQLDPVRDLAVLTCDTGCQRRRVR